MPDIFFKCSFFQNVSLRTHSWNCRSILYLQPSFCLVRSKQRQFCGFHQSLTDSGPWPTLAYFLLKAIGSFFFFFFFSGLSTPILPTLYRESVGHLLIAATITTPLLSCSSWFCSCHGQNEDVKHYTDGTTSITAVALNIHSHNHIQQWPYVIIATTISAWPLL